MIYKKIKASDEGRLLFVGDTHGRYDILKEALIKLNFSSKDTLVSVGDLVDRGPYIKETLDFFLDNENCHFVIGNHEDLMLNRIHPEIAETWLNNGGVETKQQLGDQIDNYCGRILQTAPVILEVEHHNNKYGVIHAGVPLVRNIYKWQDIIELAMSDDSYLELLLWDREAIKATSNNISLLPPIEGIDYVIHGHTPIYSPILYGNRLWIDTLYAQDALTIAFLSEYGWEYYTF